MIENTQNVFTELGIVSSGRMVDNPPETPQGYLVNRNA